MATNEACSPAHYLICQSLKIGRVFTDRQLANINAIPLERVKEITRELCTQTLSNGLVVCNVTQPGQRVPRWQALTRHGVAVA